METSVTVGLSQGSWVMIGTMAMHTFTVESTLTPAEAFARLVDLERVTEWDDGISSSKRISGAGPPLGSRFDVMVTGFDGRPTSVVYEITEADAPRHFVMVGTADAFRAVDEISIVERDDLLDGCRVTYVAGLALLGEDPPMTAEQLDAFFPKVAAVAHVGLQKFLNPPD